jgi:hypothetical protein
MSRALTGAIAALALQAAIANAADIPTGRELYQLCVQSKRGDSLDFACDAYIRGFMEGIIAQRHVYVQRTTHLLATKHRRIVRHS